MTGYRDDVVTIDIDLWRLIARALWTDGQCLRTMNDYSATLLESQLDSLARLDVVEL